MPHSPEEKKRAITRLRRIKGQAEALERAIEAGTDCAPLLQQIVAMRGATNGLMAEVMEAISVRPSAPPTARMGKMEPAHSTTTWRV